MLFLNSGNGVWNWLSLDEIEFCQINGVIQNRMSPFRLWHVRDIYAGPNLKNSFAKVSAIRAPRGEQIFVKINIWCKTSQEKWMSFFDLRNSQMKESHVILRVRWKGEWSKMPCDFKQAWVHSMPLARSSFRFFPKELELFFKVFWRTRLLLITFLFSNLLPANFIHKRSSL